MNTFTSNIVILTAEVTEQNIIGTAMTINGISLKYAATNNDVNHSIFLPESQLVVFGTMRIAAELATMGVRILNVLAVLSVPSAPVEAVVIAAPVDTALDLDSAHLETLKVDELKAIAERLGVSAVRNKKANWIEAILSAASAQPEVLPC